MLLEDIDAAFPSREDNSSSGSGVSGGNGFNGLDPAAASGGRSDVTFSGLLNVLDGVSSR